MKHVWLALLGVSLLCPLGFGQDPPDPRPVNPPTNPNAPTAPSVRPRPKARVVGRVFPAQGVTKLPELITVSISSLNSGFFKLVLVQGASFEFDDLAAGRYQIKLESNGYEDAVQEIDIDVLGPGSAHFVTVVMGPPRRDRDDEVQPREGSSTIDAAALAIPRKALQEMSKAVDASAEGDSEKAIRHLKKAVKIHPGYSEAHNNLAVQYVKLGRIDEAIDTFEKSVELQPNSKAYFNLGILYFQKNRQRESAAALSQASRLDPADQGALRALAEVYFKMGQYVLALKSYRRLAALNPDPTANLSMGYCFLRLRMMEEARTEFQRYLKGEPSGERADRVRDMLARLDSNRR